MTVQLGLAVAGPAVGILELFERGLDRQRQSPLRRPALAEGSAGNRVAAGQVR